MTNLVNKIRDSQNLIKNLEPHKIESKLPSPDVERAQARKRSRPSGAFWDQEGAALRAR